MPKKTSPRRSFLSGFRPAKLLRSRTQKMNLVLHIGTEKSGTTALQKWLLRNDEVLASKGIGVCQSLEKPNNFGLVLFGAGLKSGADLLNEISVHDEGPLARYLERKENELTEEIRKAEANGCHTFVISSEHLHSRIKTEAQAKAVHDALKPYFDKIDCVLVLRPQADLSRSVQSNHIRWGLPVSSKSFLQTATGHNYQYATIFELWTEGFGQHPHIVPYKTNPDVIKWMCDHLKIDRTSTQNPQERAKTAVSLQSAAVLHALSSVIPSGPQNVDLRERIIQKTRGQEKLTFSREDAQTLIERFREQNERLCSMTADITIDQLTPDLESYPLVGSVGALDQVDCTDVLSEVFSA